MRIAPRLIILGALIWVFIVLLMHVGKMWEIDPEDPAYDPTQIIVYFLMLVGLGVAIGGTFASFVLPAIGDQIGHLFFTPNQKIEKGPHADALAHYNRGEYEEAAESYRAVAEDNPADTHAISEVARILCDRLERPEEARKYLADLLQGEWEMSDRAFLAERLVDVLWIYLEDADAALPILEQIAEDMPETTHAANANHRRRDIEMALFEKERQAAEEVQQAGLQQLGAAADISEETPGEPEPPEESPEESPEEPPEEPPEELGSEEKSN